MHLNQYMTPFLVAPLLNKSMVVEMICPGEHVIMKVLSSSYHQRLNEDHTLQCSFITFTKTMDNIIHKTMDAIVVK